MAAALILVALLIAAPLYVVFHWRQKRAAFKGLPQPPGHSMLLGHAKVIKELADELPPGIHPAVYGYFLREKFNLPRAFYVDLWPFSHSWLLLCANELTEQVTTKPSITKFMPLKRMLAPFAGMRNLVVMEGEEWKRWRAIFNSAFSSANLAKHVPAILQETEKLLDFLSEKASSQEVFPMEPVAVDLTVGIIGHVILGDAFTAHAGGQNYKKALREQVHLVAIGSGSGPGGLRHKLDPWRKLKLWANERTMNQSIRAVIAARWANRQKNGPSHAKAFYAIDLGLDAYAANKKANGQTATDTIDAEYMTILEDHMKVFVFAGHDTSSGTICYVMWSLHKHPEWLERLRAEHAAVFGPNPANASAIIADRPNILNELPVTTAIVKETLRCYPPASTIRGSEVPYPIVDPETGETFETQGYMVWSPSFTIMRDARYFPDPNAFRPERWLKDRPAELEPALKDSHAWRPFEVGPRNCIGQELAMVEIKVALVLLLRRFDVVPAYDEDVKVDAKFDFVGGLAYPVLWGTAKPNKGMPVRVTERRNKFDLPKGSDRAPDEQTLMKMREAYNEERLS